ncbi:MAG: immunoglobulin domain-containing protein, partial [Limisphaerales bacterium]
MTLTGGISGTEVVFHWQRDGVALSDGGRISGSTTTQLTIAAVTPLDAGAYRLVGTNALGAATTEEAVVTVLVPPVITLQPVGGEAIEGDPVTLSVAATGSPPLQYQWRKDGVDLPNATNATLTLARVQPPQIGDYSVVVTNGAGSVTSLEAALRIPGQPADLWRGLVAYYPFNGNANDESGYGNDGLAVNTANDSDRFGAANAAYSFNGIDAHVEIADAPSIHSTDSLTVSVWVKANSTQTGSPYGVNIVGKVENGWSLSIVPTG